MADHADEFFPGISAGPTPYEVNTTATPTTIDIEWRIPSHNNGILESTVLRFNNDTIDLLPEDTNYTFTDLEPFTIYNISISYINEPLDDGSGGGEGVVYTTQVQTLPTGRLNINIISFIPHLF